MFKWLRRLIGSNPVVQTVNIHITGELTVKHENRPGHQMAPPPGPINTPPTSQNGGAMDRGPRTTEIDIGPELFADTRTPEVSFGIDAEVPPPGTPDKNH